MNPDKAKGERSVFRRFAAISGLNINSKSIRSCKPPRPDISCRVGKTPYYFEVTRMAHGNSAMQWVITSPSWPAKELPRHWKRTVMTTARHFAKRLSEKPVPNTRQTVDRSAYLFSSMGCFILRICQPNGRGIFWKKRGRRNAGLAFGFMIPLAIESLPVGVAVGSW